MGRRRVDKVTVEIGSDVDGFSKGVSAAKRKLTDFSKLISPLTVGIAGIACLTLPMS